jgi:hypothetical protein
LVLRDVLAMRRLSDDIELPVWRSNSGWDWAVKWHKRGIGQKLLTTAFIFYRLYLRADDKGEPYVRQTKPLGRDEGLSPVMERRAMTFSILGFIDNLRDTTLHL